MPRIFDVFAVNGYYFLFDDEFWMIFGWFSNFLGFPTSLILKIFANNLLTLTRRVINVVYYVIPNEII